MLKPVFALLFVAGVSACGPSDPRALHEKILNPTGTTEDDLARKFCRQAVKRQLRAPSTADIEEVLYNEILPNRAKGEDEAYRVDFQVDAQNAFGAKIRQMAVCYIAHLGEGNVWRVSSVRFFD